ncbi:TPA: response regulator [Photobacterium damselae]|uniref:response regulator n=1 Tax=Photobacterium iliopiscarium TaxID=56192 RepID=UPI000D1690FB|nr:response regulator [Photobacterium iliopiscarium]PST93135.1 hypothetical protein C9I87_14075 [Photobacterium iliopiscarium]
MKFLIADDNIEKQDAIKSFILRNFPQSEIMQTYAFNSTFDILRKNSIDFMFLDMTMPTYDNHEGSQIDKSLRTLAGKDLISKLAYRNMKVKTAIVTQFEVFGRHDQITPIESIYHDLQKKHPDIVLGCVVFDFQSESWEAQLLKIVRDL